MIHIIKLFFAVLDLFKKKQTPEVKVNEIEEEMKKAAQSQVPAAKDHGLDLSHHNENVDVSKLVAQGFVILKASEGASYVDKKFEARFAQLKAWGIKRGAYHFYRTNRDPILQANHFLNTVGILDGNEILALDFETCEDANIGLQTMADLRRHKPDAYAFMKYIYQETGIRPWFYTYHAVIEAVQFEPMFAEYPLWYARYTSVRPADKQGPWNKWIAWQYKSDGKIAGVSNDVDVNWYRGA